MKMIQIWKFPSNARVPGEGTYVKDVSSLDGLRVVLKEIVKEEMFADYVDVQSGEVLSYPETLRHLHADKREIEQC